MKIEEVISIYKFLGDLSWLSFIGVAFLLLAGLYLVIAAVKIDLKPGIYNAIICLAAVALFILYREASSRSKKLALANMLKETFVSSLFKQKTFDMIKASFTVSDADLEEVAALYPTEFRIGNDHKSIQLLDPGVVELINTRMAKRVLQTREMLISWLKNVRSGSTPIGSISVHARDQQFSLEKLDNVGWAINGEFINQLPGGDLCAEYGTDASIRAFKLCAAADQNQKTDTKK